MCRRLRCKQLAAAAATNTTTLDSITSTSQVTVSPVARGGDAKGAMVQLMEHVHTMDRSEAYKHMCLAQDETQRLQSEIQDLSQQKQEIIPEREMPNLPETLTTARTDAKMEHATETTKAEGGSMANGDDNRSSKANGKPNNGESISTTQSVPTKDTPEECMRASGSWLDQGGKCSIEYLPNVKCYLITLVAAEGDSLIIPQSKDGLHFTITPRVDGRNFQSILIDITFRSKVISIGQYSFITICHGWGEDLDLLLLVCLVTTTRKTAKKPSARISSRHRLLFLRVRLNMTCKNSFKSIKNSLKSNHPCLLKTHSRV